jgi:hypothetical protein
MTTISRKPVLHPAKIPLPLAGLMYAGPSLASYGEVCCRCLGTIHQGEQVYQCSLWHQGVYVHFAVHAACTDRGESEP